MKEKRANKEAWKKNKEENDGKDRYSLLTIFSNTRFLSQLQD